MKTNLRALMAFSTFMAWVSFGLFASLMVAAMYEYIVIRPRIHVTIAIPADHYNHADYIDTVQLDCLARNVFFEASDQNAEGKMWVAMVVMERTQSPHFPSTICGVVNQANTDGYGNNIKYKCSFSWRCDGEQHDIDFTNAIVAKAWEQSYTIAKLVMTGKLKPKLDMEGVTHYHAIYVKPFWIKSKNYKLVARIGDHMFYRWSKATLPKLNVASI